jgi:hypothetical protein
VLTVIDSRASLGFRAGGQGHGEAIVVRRRAHLRLLVDRSRSVEAGAIRTGAGAARPGWERVAKGMVGGEGDLLLRRPHLSSPDRRCSPPREIAPPA